MSTKEKNLFVKNYIKYTSKDDMKHLGKMFVK